MKKMNIMMTALVALTAGLCVNLQANEEASANAPKKTEVVAAAKEAVVSKLSADEQAFAAKLNEQNKKAFNEQFSAEQRKAAMAAGCAGSCNKTAALNPNDAVQKVVKEQTAKVAETKAPAPAQAPAAQAK